MPVKTTEALPPSEVIFNVSVTVPKILGLNVIFNFSVSLPFTIVGTVIPWLKLDKLFAIEDNVNAELEAEIIGRIMLDESPKTLFGKFADDVTTRLGGTVVADTSLEYQLSFPPKS